MPMLPATGRITQH